MSEIMKERLSDDLLEGATGGKMSLQVKYTDKKSGSVLSKVITIGSSKKPK